MEERELMKSTYKRTGFSLFGMGIAAIIAQVLFTIVMMAFGASEQQLNDGSWLMWMATFVPMYCIAMPLFVLLMRNLPATEGNRTTIKVKDFIVLLLICFPIMYGGNLLGNLLSMVVTGGSAVNPLDSYAMEGGMLKVLIMVIIGPVMEEWIFRKQLIDRCVQYGEKKAVLFSAITFGLFHMNLFQLFYAFGIGLVFAYIYVRTRNLLYPVLLHVIVNFMGAVIAPWIIGKVDMEALMAFSESGGTTALSEDLLAGVLLLLAYALLLLACSIAGLVLLIIKAKKSKFLAAKEDWCGKETYGNAGTICYIIFCIIMILISLFAV